MNLANGIFLLVLCAASAFTALAEESMGVILAHRSIYLVEQNAVSEKISFLSKSSIKVKLVVEDGRPNETSVTPISVKVNGKTMLTLTADNKRPSFKEIDVSLISGTNVVDVGPLPKNEGYFAISIVKESLPAMTKTIDINGGTLSLAGIAVVTIPAKAFTKPTKVELVLSRTQSATDDYFVSTPIFAGVGPRLPFEIRIRSGKETTKLPMQLSVTLPANFAKAKTIRTSPKGFGEVYFSGENEVLDQFESLKTTHDSAHNLTSIVVDPMVFTDTRERDSIQEAIVVVGSVFSDK